MEVAVIADVHSNLPALEAVLEEIEGMRIFCVGDVVGYNPFPNETLDIFRSRKIDSVMGNHDHAVLSMDFSWFNRAAAKSLQWTSEVLEEGGRTYLQSLQTAYRGDDFTALHGSPRNHLFEYVYPEYSEATLNTFLSDSKVLILAHTHTPFIKHLKSGVIFNPGSVGQPRDGDPKAAYAIFNTEKRDVTIKRAAYDIDKVAEEIRSKGLSESLAERLYRGI